MKEAPEKLYLIRNTSMSTSLNTTNDHHDEFLQEWYKGREKDTDIEYTRTDAFIKKACDFFEENIEEEDCKIGSSEWTELRVEYKSLDSFIRAFVKYIKESKVWKTK